MLGRQVEVERSPCISDLLSLSQIRTVRSLIPNSDQMQDVPFFGRHRLPGGLALAIDRLDLSAGRTIYSICHEGEASTVSVQFSDLLDPQAVHVLGPDDPGFDIGVDDVVASLGSSWSRIRHLFFRNAYPPCILVDLPLIQHRGARPVHVEYDLCTAAVFVNQLLEDLDHDGPEDLKDFSLPLMEGMTVTLRLETASMSKLAGFVTKDAPGWSRIRLEMKGPAPEGESGLSFDSCYSG